MRGGNDVMVVGMMAAVGGRMRGGNDVMVMGMMVGGGGQEFGEFLPLVEYSYSSCVASAIEFLLY